MTNYRRTRVPGGRYFFTVNLLDRQSNLLVREIETLRHAVRTVLAKAPFQIDAWVVLPDHMHCLWTLPAGDTNYSARWQAIKTNFSKAIPPRETVSPSRAARGERGLWQRRFWEHTIRNDSDYAAHLDYIHFNPVRHGLVTSATEWPYSSFHRCVATGLYPADWHGSNTDIGNAGEAPARSPDPP